MISHGQRNLRMTSQKMRIGSAQWRSLTLRSIGVSHASQAPRNFIFKVQSVMKMSTTTKRLGRPIHREAPMRNKLHSVRQSVIEIQTA